MRRSVTVLFALALTLLLASPASAQLFKDDFTGAVGDTLNTHGYIIYGSGAPSYVNPLKVVSPGLTYGTYAGSGVGNAVELKNLGQDLGVVFKPDTIRTGNVYAAFLMNIKSVGAPGDYFVHFVPSPTSGAYTAKVFAKTDSAGGFFMGLSKTSEVSSGAAIYGTTHFSIGTTYLVILKFEFVPGASNDLMTLYVLSGGEVPAAEPATAEIQQYNGSVKTDPVGFTIFCLRQGGAVGAPNLTLDGIRIDTTWTGALGIVPPQFSVAPSALEFGNIWVDSTKADSVTVTNNSTTDMLSIDSVVTTNSDFTVNPTSELISTSSSANFTVTYHPSTAGSDTGLVILYHGVAQDTVTVTGIGTDVTVALFSLSSKSHSFGTIRAGQEKSDTLLLRNAGNATLRISGFTKKDTTFHVALEADSVLAGDSTRLVVRFAPQTTGAYSDTVVFTSNASEVTDTLFLSGSSNDLVTIAAARALSVGSEVIVRGIVTRAMGSYTFFQDSTGGMIMYANHAGTPANDSVASGYIQKGDLLEVHGRTSQYNALMEIGNTDILGFQKISSGNPLPEPKIVTLAELDSNGESYESQLITLKKLSFTAPAGTFANKTSYHVADSSDASGNIVLRIQATTDTQLGGKTAPTGTFSFVGVLGQFTSTTGGYQLLPVDSTDVVADVITDGITALPSGVPQEFALGQNFPNPFNPTTTIQYALPVESHVTVKIYNTLGQEVRILVSETQKASYYRIVWDGLNEFQASVATGIYFCRFTAEPVGGGNTAAPFVQVQKMLLLK